jgi:hypothetical protein
MQQFTLAILALSILAAVLLGGANRQPQQEALAVRQPAPPAAEEERPVSQSTAIPPTSIVSVQVMGDHRASAESCSQQRLKELHDVRP